MKENKENRDNSQTKNDIKDALVIADMIKNGYYSYSPVRLAEESSGKHKGQVVFSKRGRPLLRKLLYMAVLSLISNNPEFKRLHQNNTKVKNVKGTRSILKLIGKLARILVGMAKRDEAYCSKKVHMLPSVA